MASDEVELGFWKTICQLIQRVVDFFESHRIRTGHMPVQMWIERQRSHTKCECGIWDVKAIMVMPDDLLA